MDFLYSGVLNCGFADDAFLLWQLLCLCVQYALPALVHVLVNPMHAPVLPALFFAADKVGLTPDERCFAACVLLKNPAAALGSIGDGPSRTEGAVHLLLAALAE